MPLTLQRPEPKETTPQQAERENCPVLREYNLITIHHCWPGEKATSPPISPPSSQARPCIATSGDRPLVNWGDKSRTVNFVEIVGQVTQDMHTAPQRDRCLVARGEVHVIPRRTCGGITRAARVASCPIWSPRLSGCGREGNFPAGVLAVPRALAHHLVTSRITDRVKQSIVTQCVACCVRS
jgi:hypothetical protein